MGILLSIAGVLVSVFAGYQLLGLLYRHEYAVYNNVLIWLMIVAGMCYITSFLGYGMTAARYFRVQLPLFMVVVAVTFGASLWLIPRFALTGAALAMGVGALAQLVGSCFVFVHILQKKNVKGVSL
jgi:O-antigen/teichoic acid export membrane protein